MRQYKSDFNFGTKSKKCSGDACPSEGTGDETSDSGVVCNNNEIYFFSEVTKDSVLNLVQNITRIGNELVISAINYDIPLETFQIKLHINSPGGNLIDGLYAVDNIINSKIPIKTIVSGEAASAASLISICAHKREIHKNSFMLIHQLSAGCWGTYANFKDEMDNLNLLMDKLTKIYQKHTKLPIKKLQTILKHDLFLDAETCLKYGLVDSIIG